MKKFLSAVCDPLPRVDLAGAQPGDQRLGREVDEHDLVGLAEDAVGQRLPHPGPRELGDLVVERLEVLDVDGREDVDAGAEHVLDVLEALRVLRARRVRMGELVDEAELGGAAQDRQAVHLVERDVAIASRGGGAPPPGRPPAPRSRAGVRLEVADHDVPAGLRLGLALLQHPVGLPDAGGHAQEDLVVTAVAAGRRAERDLRRRGHHG